MQAQVIVDLPLFQTDKPFTYQVSKEDERVLQIGSRVHVPFGASNRLIQGIVVGLSEEEQVGLKPIAEVLDFTPVFTNEQFWLADQIRKTVFSYKISILKAMLPNLLHSTYDKVVRPVGHLHPFPSFFGMGQSILFSRLNDEEKKEALRLLQEGKVEMDYLAKEKGRVKTEKWFRVSQEALERLVVSSRSKKKLALKEELWTYQGEFPLAKLKENYSNSILAYFEEEGVLHVWEKEVNRLEALYEGVEESRPLVLNLEQEIAKREILSLVDQEEQTYLLEGVTGSGKTEVYLQVIEEVLAKGKTAIMLVPEISLTPQVTKRFVSRFGQQVAILHSALSDGEKYDEWRKIQKGQARVVVGARSAIFAPLDNIGAIIIDEEHESSYKQENNPRYHAREVAKLRAQYHQAALVLGSATPSLESRARASKGVYRFLTLSQRANPMASLPAVEVIDFRDYIGQQELGNFTPPLLEKIGETLARKEQVVLLLNRRGYSSFVMCRECGEVDQCPNCDISLTLHMDTRSMQCHYCGFQKGIPQQCPTCESSSMRYYGTGTQKAFEELQEAFPTARILRMDVDTTRKKGSHETLLASFGKGEADILLGTQMIAKGLDFPNVTLVGVLNADTGLHLPDFRASERTFQLLTQVAGRAGRAEKKGTVVIQTYNPDHYAIEFAQNQDYEGFYQYEMKSRHGFAYPPYTFTVGLSFSHRDEDFVVKKAYETVGFLRSQLSNQIQILGPTPKTITRTHNLFHYQIILKYRKEDNLEAVLNAVLDWSQEKENKHLRLVIDTEPQNMM